MLTSGYTPLSSKGLKEAEKVKFEGLYHIYDYALKLLLGSDYKPLRTALL